MLRVLAIVALLVSPALADKNKKKGDDAPPPEPPAEQAPKKNKNKDKEEAPAAPPAAPPQADAPKNKNKDKKKDDAPSPPAAPPPTEAPKGGLKPGQGVGRHICLGSTSGIGNIEVTSARTVGVATCNGELKRVFLEKGICKGRAPRTKVEYGWQFADTTGKDAVSCP